MSEQPTCPICQSDDIVKEEDGEKIVYVCEICGHTWEE